jgi:hypothetical protein
LQTGESAALHDQLLAEIGTIASGPQAASWAHRRLPDKNKLNAGDARRIEVAFEAKLVSLAEDEEEASPSALPAAALNPPAMQPDSSAPQHAPLASKSEQRIDKAALAFPAPRRARDKQHLRFVARQACLICGRSPSDPTTYASRKAVLSVEKSVTALWCRSVVHTIANRIAMEMKPRGGNGAAQTRLG